MTRPDPDLDDLIITVRNDLDDLDRRVDMLDAAIDVTNDALRELQAAVRTLVDAQRTPSAHAEAQHAVLVDALRAANPTPRTVRALVARLRDLGHRGGDAALRRAAREYLDEAKERAPAPTAPVQPSEAAVGAAVVDEVVQTPYGTFSLPRGAA